MKLGRPECFVLIYEKLKLVAYRYGYALAIHGSLSRDLDLIAVPWIKSAASEKALIKAIIKESGGFLAEHDVNPVIKPHGRHGWAIQLGGGSYIDISVMPKIKGGQ